MKRNLIALSITVFFLAALQLCLPAQTQADTFTLVKTIDLLPLVGDDGSIEVDVVDNQLYVANWIQDKYFRIDPVTGNLLGSFSLSNGILMDNHGSDYNPATGTILHARDRDGGGPLGYDAFFETDTNGVLTKGPYPLFGPGYITNDPEGLTIDPATGRVWVSLESGGGGPSGIFEINPNNGTVVSHLNVGPAFALGFNPKSGKLFFADQNGVIKEVAPDGSGQATVFDPGVGFIFGMAFTPTGDLVLLDFAAVNYGILLPSQLLLYDSSYDADDVFTTAIPFSIDIKPGSGPNSINPKSHGKIPVAILSTEEFDALQMVNKDSLTFGRTGEENSLAFCNHRGEDVNADGLKDLVCHFFTEDTGFVCGDTEGVLKCATTDGTPIEGRDSVKVVPCKK